VTKARGLQGYEPKGKLGVMPHVPGSARECEGIDTHTLEFPLWELESRWTPQIFKVQLQGSKPIAVTSFLYQWKDIKT
jgi:hypothetical protein